MKILLTAFDAFGGSAINAAQEAVQNVSIPPSLADVRKVTIPTVFRESIEALAQAIKGFQPDAVLCVGQAGDRAAVAIERVAINLMDARIPDNKGCQPVDEPIVENAPAAYFSTIPIKKVMGALNAQGIPAEISNTAGTYVCNQLLYGCLHYVSLHCPQVQAGFIHVPCIPEQLKASDGKTFAMELPQIVQALEIAVKTLADERLLFQSL